MARLSVAEAVAEEGDSVVADDDEVDDADDVEPAGAAASRKPLLNCVLWDNFWD